MKMLIKKNNVLLLKVPKPDDGEDKYETLLKQGGYDVVQVKTLEFQYRNLTEYKNCLDNPHDYSGIIFSSPRCVRATVLALNGEKLHPDWSEKDNYVVGVSTHAHAYEDLKLTCMGKETGNANNLADKMLTNRSRYNRPFLYPHGNLKMDILKGRFEKNLKLREVYVYDTVTNPRIGEELKSVVEDGVPEFMVFFSPSGLKACMNFLEGLPIRQIKMIAIGPTTEAAMKEHKIEVFGVCNQPTPEDLIKVISAM